MVFEDLRYEVRSERVQFYILQRVMISRAMDIPYYYSSRSEQYLTS